MPDLSLQHRFELITAPAAEPVTVTDAKKQMRIEHSDDDALITRLIKVAIEFVDVRGALGKAMITQTWGEWLAPNPSLVYLSLGSVQSVSAIKYFDMDNVLQTATLSNFHVLGTAGRTLVSPKTGYAWPSTFQRMASTTDVYGNSTGDWSNHANRYAHIIEWLGQEDI